MPERAIELFNQVKTPDEIIINLFFNACAQVGTKEALDLVKKTSEQMPKSFYSNNYILSSLLDALMKCGDVEHAQSVFDSSTSKAPSVYGALMKGNNRQIDIDMNLNFFFEGYVKNNMPERAIDLFHKITDLDEVNVIILFNACAYVGTQDALRVAKRVAGQIPRSYYSNPLIPSTLLDVFTKCGDIPSAEIVFAKMARSSEDYGMLMNAFNEENSFNKTLKLFHQMKRDGVERNLLNYLHIIKALSRIGDYSLSQSIVEEIPRSILADRQIQTALVDMWVR